VPSFIDTSVLLYAVGDHADERVKRDVAAALLDRGDCVLSVQVLQEFYAQATHETRTAPLTHHDACEFIDAWRRFRTIQNTLDLFWSALELKAALNYSYWDCAVIAAAQAAGCEALYTEDMQHGRTIRGVRIVDPFLQAG
jgi:predicted nucleic acid-binding protein